MIFLVFCILNVINTVLYFRKKYLLFIFLSIAILFVEPLFQKLLDVNMKGESWNVFGFDRLKSNLVVISSYLGILAFSPSIKSPLPMLKSIHLYAIALVIFHIINTIFSLNQQNSLAIVIVSIIGPLMFFYILLGFPKDIFCDNASILKIIYSLTIFFVLIGLFLYNRTSVDLFDVVDGRTAGGIWLSNIATQILALFFPFVFSKHKFKYSGVLRLFSLFSYLVLIFVSLSRTALVVYLSMSLIILFGSKVRFRNFIRLLISVTILYYLASEWFNNDIFESFSNRFNSVGSSRETIVSDSRFGVYAEAFEIVKGHEILGTGISSFNVLNENGFSNAHNIFINIFVERGIIGIVFLLLFIKFFLSTNKMAFKAFGKYSYERETLRLIKIGVFGFFLIALTGNELYTNSGFITGWATYLLLFLLVIQIQKVAWVKNNYGING